MGGTRDAIAGGGGIEWPIKAVRSFNVTFKKWRRVKQVQRTPGGEIEEGIKGVEVHPCLNH